MNTSTIHLGGLVYFPSRYDPPLGYSALEVRLTPRPCGRYFDARRARLPLMQNGVGRHFALEHPYNALQGLAFTQGRIRLESHGDDCEEIITFGGRVSFACCHDETVLRIDSPAPFIPIADPYSSPLVTLMAEWEIVLAQLRAQWGADEEHILGRLERLPPMTLFVASTWLLIERLRRLQRYTAEADIRRALDLAEQTRATLQAAGEWPADPVDLLGLPSIAH